MIDLNTPEIEVGTQEMEIVEAVKALSKEAGHSMLVLTMVNEEGQTIKDWLIYKRSDGKTPRQTKWRSFFWAIDREDRTFGDENFNDEGHCEEFEGLSVLVNIKHDIPKDKVTGAEGYPTATVAGYLRRP